MLIKHITTIRHLSLSNEKHKITRFCSPDNLALGLGLYCVSTLPTGDENPLHSLPSPRDQNDFKSNQTDVAVRINAYEPIALII